MLESLIDDYVVNEGSCTVLPVKEGEAAGGFHILGKLVGPHFVPNGESRNKRWYPRSLWEKALGDPKVTQKLERKLMFGTIGHAENFDVEKFAREGLLSHVTVKAWIDESTGLGMCEDWILDTPAGRNLHAMCKAGSRFYTSSRASGSFKNEKYRGMPVVDESTYELSGWDMVVDPGFLEADPSLVESLKKNGITLMTSTISEEHKNGGKDMSTELIEKLTKEKIAVENGLREALKELESYKKIGTPARIREALKAYMELGKPAEIAKAFDVAEAAVKKMQGSLKQYETLGSIPEVQKKMKELKEAKEAYDALGTPAEIDEALDKAASLAKASRKSKNESVAKRLAKVYRTPLRTAYSLVEKLGAREAERTLKALREDDESGYNLGLEGPGNDADDTLLKHFDDEGEEILGDVVGDGGSDFGGDDLGGSDDLGDEGDDLLGGDDLGDEGDDLGDEGDDLGDEEEEDEEEEEKKKEEARRRARIKAKKLQESKKKQKKGGYQTSSIFEQLVKNK